MSDGTTVRLPRLIGTGRALDPEVIAARLRVADVQVIHVRPGEQSRYGFRDRTTRDAFLRAKNRPPSVRGERQPVPEQILRKAAALRVADAFGLVDENGARERERSRRQSRQGPYPVAISECTGWP